MSQESENNENSPPCNCDETDAGLPETYQPPLAPTPPRDTTNHLFPVLRRRKTMALAIFLLCFGSALFAIESITPIYRAHAKLALNVQDKSLLYKQLYKLQSARQSPDTIRISLFPGSNVIDVFNYDHDPQRATKVLNSFTRDFMVRANSKFSSEPEPKKRAEKTPDTPEYLEAKNKYLILKTRLANFINKDGSINLEGDEQAKERLRSETLDDLLEKERKQNYAFDVLSQRYGEKHPKIIEARAELATISAQIKAEREALLSSLIDDYINAKTTFDALEKASQTPDIVDNNQPTSKLPPVQILKTAGAPEKPVFPNKNRMIGFSLLLSLLLAVLIPLLVEKLRKTFISGQELSNFFGLPCYALIPEIQGEENKPLADYVLDNPSDTLTEAVHSLHLNIKLKGTDQETENKVVLVTSSKEDEGKTMLCTWLARLSAKSGERVLLIDANLRDPCVHKALNGRNTLSLVEYLAGKAQLDEVTDKADPSGLHVIYGRAIPNSVLDLLSSRKMEKFLQEARELYDLIIIDTPACLASADARALSANADLLLYLVGWNKTKRDVIHKGLSQFLSFTQIRTALILSNINLKKHIEYGYGDVICEDDA